MPDINLPFIFALSLPCLAVWLIVAERGRDLVAVTFCRGRSFHVQDVVSSNQHPTAMLIRKLHPYVVSRGGGVPRLVLAASAADAARVLLASNGPVAVECTTHRYRIVEASPGTWAMVWVPAWLGTFAGVSCEHGALENHRFVFGGEVRREEGVT